MCRTLHDNLSHSCRRVDHKMVAALHNTWNGIPACRSVTAEQLAIICGSNQSFASAGEDLLDGITVGDHRFGFSPQAAAISVVKERATPTGTGLLEESPKYNRYK
jgi:hypothetical protein